MRGLPLTTRAPAKINLSLHIKARRADGYHLLESFVAFASVGDELSLHPAHDLALGVSGPHCAMLAGNSDNLVLKAVRYLLALKPDLQTGHFHLVKRLPVASGIGGGSADAAAALRLMGRMNGLPPNDSVLMQAALLTGSDVPVCLASKPRFMIGTGAVLGPVIPLPKLFAVLVNPAHQLGTAQVFGELAMARDSGEQALALPQAPCFGNATLLAQWLRQQRNDLEAPAMTMAPVIAAVLSEMRHNPACQMARMSGSGATCFGLFADSDAAARAARILQCSHRNWWIKPTILR